MMVQHCHWHLMVPMVLSGAQITVCMWFFMFSISKWIPSGISGFFTPPKHADRWITGYYKMSIGVNTMCVCVCGVHPWCLGRFSLFTTDH